MNAMSIHSAGIILRENALSYGESPLSQRYNIVTRQSRIQKDCLRQRYTLLPSSGPSIQIR
jgi:hypothetical protein